MDHGVYFLSMIRVGRVHFLNVQLQAKTKSGVLYETIKMASTKIGIGVI